MEIVKGRFLSFHIALMGKAVLLYHVKSVVCFIYFVPKIIHHLIAEENLPLTADFFNLDRVVIKFDAILAAHIASGSAVPDQEIIEGGIGTPYKAGAVHLVKLDNL